MTEVPSIAVARLLAETAWLGRLARELVPAADRDDLVQDVLVRALQRDAMRWPRAWLATVARNLARQRRGSDLSRRAREATVARPEASAQPAAEVAVGFATHRAVVNAVTELEEPYRAAVLLRFWEALPPRAVARRTGVPVETARTRIKRGIERLRRLLDEHAGDRDAWLVPLLQIDAVQRALATGSTVAATWSFGVLTMKHLLLAGAALVGCVSLALAIAIAPPTVLDSVAPPATATRIAVMAPVVDAGMASAPGASAGAGVQRVVVPSVAVGAVAVRVRDADGEPVTDIGVSVWPRADDAALQTRSSDAAGKVRFDGLAGGEVVVALDRGGQRSLCVEPGNTTACEFVLPVGLTVHGSVRSPDREPVADAVICRVDPTHPGLLLPLGRSDAAGVYEVRAVPSTSILVARKPGWQAGDARGRRVASGRPGEHVTLNLQLGARACALRGRVLTGAGQSAPRAWVLVAVDEDCRKRVDGLAAVRTDDGLGPLDREAIVLRADAEGRFASEEIPWGDIGVFARGAGELAALVGEATAAVRPGAVASVELRLQPGAELVGSVRDTDGAPYAGLELCLAHVEGPVVGDLARDVLGHAVADRRTVVGADGSYRFTGIGRGDFSLCRMLPDGLDRLARVRIGTEAPARVDLEVARTWGLRIVVRDAAGVPQVGWAVMLTPPGRLSFRDLGRLVTDVGGAVVASGLRGEELVLTVHAPATTNDTPWQRLPSLVRKVTRSERVLAITATAPRGAIVGRVLAGGGGPCQRATVSLQLADVRETLRTTTDLDGRFAFATLPAGGYGLVAMGQGPAIQRIVVLQEAQQLDLGDLVCATAAEVEVRLAGDCGPPGDATVALLEPLPPDAAAPWGHSAQLRWQGDCWRGGVFATGNYLLQVSGPEFAPLLVPIDLQVGATARRRIACERGVEVAVRVAFDGSPAARVSDAPVGLEVFDAQDRPLLSRQFDVAIRGDAAGEVATSLHLMPGSYRVRCERRRKSVSTALLVPAGGAALRLQAP